MKRVGKKREEQFFLICVVKGILETRKKRVSSRCERFCSSDVELTAPGADKPRRIKGFKTGWSYGEKL